MPFDQQAQLTDLIVALKSLILILEQDPACQWTHHFRECLGESRRLEKHGFTQDDLHTLSASVMSVYGGTGSFNDYSPITSSSELDGDLPWQSLPSSEKLGETSLEVFEKALALRAIEE